MYDRSLCPGAKCFLLWSVANIDFKFKEHIPATVIELDELHSAFRRFGLLNNAEKPQSIEYGDYIAQNLGRIRCYFEKHGVLNTIGGLNGTPQSIELNCPDPKWQNIVKGMRYGNSFIRAAENADMTLQELIDYVLEMELSGKIKKLPAMEKKIFIVSPYNEVPLKTAYEIITASIDLEAFKKTQIERLVELIKSEDRQSYIKQYFQDIYQ